MTAAVAATPVRNSGLRLQRSCACGQHTTDGATCERCAQEKNEAPAIVREVLRSAGDPLDPPTRNDMERRFHADFSRVRVHSDEAATRSAKAVNARAYTVGRHIVFGPGNNARSGEPRRHLLAHELTHVLQQGAGDVPAGAIPFSRGDERAEQEAETNAARVGDGMKDVHATATGLQLARQSGSSDSGYFTDVEQAPETECIVPFNGKTLDEILSGSAFTVVEFSSTTCTPCKTLAGFLRAECNKHSKDKTPIHFYSVDVDKNPELAERYARQSIPQLYVFRGKNQLHHSDSVKTIDFYSQLFNSFAAQKPAENSPDTGSMGIPRWALSLITGATFVAVAGIAMAIAGRAGAKLDWRAGLAIAGGALAAGLLIGALDPFGWTKRTKFVGAGEADALIRKRFGKYIAAAKQGEAPLHNAKVETVPQSQLKALWECRHTGEKASDSLVGWTDQGSQPGSKQQAQGAANCAGVTLQNASYDTPVIYYASDVKDATVLLHEGLHAYEHPKFSESLRNFASEGATEYFTRQIADDIRAEAKSGYDDEVEKVRALVGVIGEDALRQAYFKGNFDPADKVLGKCGLEAWALDLQMGSENAADEILKKPGGDHCH